MANIKLTDTERLLLANQYEILSKLNDDQDLARLANNLRAGHVSMYQDRLHVAPNLTPATEQHVYDTLSLYSLLKDGYEQLTDQSGVDKKALTFAGFDGNNEDELLRFARALADNEQFRDVLGSSGQDVPNSHGHTRETDERMIAAWKKLKPKQPFTKETINTILAARKYPGAN